MTKPITIEDVKVFVVQTHGPGMRFIVVKVITSEPGLYGLGCATFTQRYAAVVGALEHHVIPFVKGRDVSRIEEIFQMNLVNGYWRNGPVLNNAISGIDQALWDIKGKALGVPVYTLLGGLARDRVVCYPHTGAGDSRDPQSLVEACLRAKEESWKFVRFSVGYADNVLEPRRAVLDTIRRFRAVREAVGDEMEIVFDVHTRLDLPDALWLCEEVKPFRPFFMEDPLRSEDPESYRMLRLRTELCRSCSR